MVIVPIVDFGSVVDYHVYFPNLTMYQSKSKRIYSNDSVPEIQSAVFLRGRGYCIHKIYILHLRNLLWYPTCRLN